MTTHPRMPTALAILGTCVIVAVAVVAMSWVSKSPAHATPSAVTVATILPAPPAVTVATGLPAAQNGEFGTIKGRLVWGGEQVPTPKVLQAKGKADKDATVCASKANIIDEKVVADAESKGVRDGIAFLVRLNGSNPEATKALTTKKPKVEIDQKDCVFIPHSVALHQDQQLVFKSSDAVNHNVHLSAFTNQPFNTILPPNGSMTKSLVAEKRAMPLTCDIHPWMKANIMVFDHPFFAVTAKDGSFEIKGVPAGPQNLVVWQEGVGYVTPGFARGITVEIIPGKVTDVGEIKLDPAKVK